jgi:hypothetical protein
MGRVAMIDGPRNVSGLLIPACKKSTPQSRGVVARDEMANICTFVYTKTKSRSQLSLLAVVRERTRVCAQTNGISDHESYASVSVRLLSISFALYDPTFCSNCAAA